MWQPFGHPQEAWEVLIRSVLPAAAPDRVELGRQRQQVLARAGGKEVRETVHGHVNAWWTVVLPKTPERDDAVDVTKEQWFLAHLQGSCHLHPILTHVGTGTATLCEDRLGQAVRRVCRCLGREIGEPGLCDPLRLTVDCVAPTTTTS